MAGPQYDATTLVDETRSSSRRRSAKSALEMTSKLMTGFLLRHPSLVRDGNFFALGSAPKANVNLLTIRSVFVP
jgi:hypothetical protein